MCSLGEGINCIFYFQPVHCISYQGHFLMGRIKTTFWLPKTQEPSSETMFDVIYVVCKNADAVMTIGMTNQLKSRCGI